MVDEINEKSLSGAQRYYMHSQAHDQAAKKYSISAKSVDPEQAKIHRKLGRFHKTISAVLSQIAGVHTSNDFNRAMKKKAENMANKKVNEDLIEHKVGDTVRIHPNLQHPAAGETGTITRVINDSGIGGKKKGYMVKHNSDHEPFGENEIVKEEVENEDGDVVLEDEHVEFEDEEFVTEHLDMLNALYDREPGAFSSVFASLMQRKALDRIEELKIDIAQSAFSEDEDIHEDVEQVDEISQKLARNYASKAAEDLSKINDQTVRVGNSKSPDQKKLNKLARKFDKRNQGLDHANKRTGGVKYTPKF